METVTTFIFFFGGGGSKITEDGDCSHEIKRHLFLGRKVSNQPRQHIEKQRHYFANKGPSSQSYVFFFPVVICGYEIWTIKKAEHRRIDAFELWCWRRLLRVPWTAEPEILILWSPDVKNWLIWKDSDAGKNWWQEKEMTGWDDMMA